MEHHIFKKILQLQPSLTPPRPRCQTTSRSQPRSKPGRPTTSSRRPASQSMLGRCTTPTHGCG
ncbi:hypothetical protein BDW69DRAFT_178421 [Aspergillus filifer]